MTESGSDVHFTNGRSNPGYPNFRYLLCIFRKEIIRGCEARYQRINIDYLHSGISNDYGTVIEVALYIVSFLFDSGLSFFTRIRIAR